MPVLPVPEMDANKVHGPIRGIYSLIQTDKCPKMCAHDYMYMRMTYSSSPIISEWSDCFGLNSHDVFGPHITHTFDMGNSLTFYLAGPE